MIPAWTVLPVVFLALTGKYYGYDLFDVAHHRRAKKRKITEKEWLLVFQYLGIQKEVEPFVHSQTKRSLGYVVFIVLALIFLVISLDLPNPNFSFAVPYLYSLLFSLLSGVFFFISVRILLGPKRTWKLTVRYHDVDRYLVPWGEWRNDRS